MSFEQYCRERFPNVFYNPFDGEQRESLVLIERALRERSFETVVMRRGCGATSLAMASCVYAIECGYAVPMYIGTSLEQATCVCDLAETLAPSLSREIAFRGWRDSMLGVVKRNRDGTRRRPDWIVVDVCEAHFNASPSKSASLRDFMQRTLPSIPGEDYGLHGVHFVSSDGGGD